MEPETYEYVPSVFDAVSAEKGAPEAATRGLRLLNFLVDGAACLLLYYPLGYLISATLYRFGADLFAAVQSPLKAWPVATVLFLVIAGAYFFVLETGTRGRSLGKWVTGTKAVRTDGRPITPNNAFVRSLCRLIPAEPFSALFGQPWHDRFSKTWVVRVKKTFLPEPSTLPDSSANYDVKQ